MKIKDIKLSELPEETIDGIKIYGANRTRRIPCGRIPFLLIFQVFN